MKRLLSLSFLLLFFFSCANSQNRESAKVVGGPCDGCEAVFEYGDSQLTSTDTLPDFSGGEEKLKIEGTVYQNDGKTPANDVILYVYHTDSNGIYAAKEDATGLAKRHGYNRGWVKTDKNGKYIFYTIKPGTYPDRSEPAHIHYTVLEPDGKYYWIESSFFKGDPLLTEKEINPDSPRGGGPGLLTLRKEGELLVGTRDIVLGKNIPNYE